ncbi:DUF1329 domain-containing protein [Acidocella sp.]|uniref:DUF1329 domain-containing protein n=1 Tax=Acidocella sp. TaxID=50710 RepID=UPI002610674D|nr:DUF1329 domain-containing protein [Acidocella sp.]
MKRRHFGLFASSGLATLAALSPRRARAQAAPPDPSQLTTTLTPMGGERAGNADGTIPPWTGGLTGPALPPDQPVVGPLFTDEAPLYTVTADNMAQYASLLTPGTQRMMTQFGFSVKVYKTHRTAAAPQYVYDNTARNVTRAKLDPAGGRLGFTGAYGGVPFPIIDTADPLTGGAQLIWNHLTAWNSASYRSSFVPSYVMINGGLSLSAGGAVRFVYPYYDPDGTLENFDGYYSKLHTYVSAPPSVVGQEELVWHSTNVNDNPDIVWSLLNGQGRVRKAPDEAFDTPNPSTNGISNIDESSCFYGNPAQYDWSYIGKQEMLVPYNCNNIHSHKVQEIMLAHFANPDIVRWEKHRVWVLEANLHPGEHNVNARRRLYIDEDSWYALLGEAYDASGNMVKTYALYNECIPSLPGTTQQAEATFSLMTGDWTFGGSAAYRQFEVNTYLGPQAPSYFEPQVMAANASF